MAGLRDLLIRSKGAAPVSHQSVHERTAQINADPNGLTIHAPRDEAEAKAIAELEKYRAANADLKVESPKPPKPRRKASARQPRPEAEPLPSREVSVAAAPPMPAVTHPRENVEFVIAGVGVFENEVDAVIIDDQVISTWDSGAAESPGKFRAQFGLELILRHDGEEFNIYSPGVHIHNPDLNVTVSVYLRK